MTVWIYVDTSEKVATRKDHLKFFANEDAKFGLRRTTRKALLSSIGGRGPSPLAGGF